MVFSHENNIKNKINSNYNGKFDIEQTEKLIKFYEEIYLPVKCQLLGLDFKSLDVTIFDTATNIMNDYIAKLHNFANNMGIRSESKFESTFLEEINIYLFSKLNAVEAGILGIYNKGVYAGMKLGNNMNIDIIKKDVDFCIGKEIELCIDDVNKINIIVPIIAVEVKTYLDATMFGEVQFSSKQLKDACPNVKTYILMGYNQVAKEKILAARHDNIMDEMFVLRKDRNASISTEVLLDYYIEIENNIKAAQFEETIELPGRLIRPDNKNI
ncbi:MAG: Bpu10I family restriction endonuclease [Clostridia bacterium]|nr:Bpu10I family restriction endonuclease [Clostridia bacterium]MDD4387591.1 Bpu10I family restriction endonuclease [Clostridia bacterium]